MKKIILFIFFLFINCTCWAQKTSFDDLDEALKQPQNVKSLHFNNGAKYSSSQEIPASLLKCSNVNKIYFGWHKNLDLTKLFSLLAQLPQLDSLEMYACDLKVIPKEIGLLTHLRYLKIDANQITSLHPDISKLKALEYLDISSNELTVIPENIGELSQLKELSAGDNKIELLPSSVCDLKNLTQLSLTSNQIKTLPENIHQLKSLTKLGLYGNPLISIPKGIGQLPLHEIYVGGYKNELQAFPYEIFNITTLERLGIFDMDIDSFPETFTKLQNLNYLSIRNLKGFNWKDAFLKIGQLKKVKKLCIVYYREGEISKEIEACTSVTDLELSGRKKSYKTMQYVSAMKNLESLTYNDYMDTILPPEIKQLNKLRYMEFHGCKLMALPPEIAELDSLQELKLSANWNQSLLLPGEIGDMPSLKILGISSFQLKNLPEEIGHLNSLEELSIWGCNLKEVPRSIGGIQHLKRISLSGNNIETLPAELYQLHSLKVLLIGENELSHLANGISNLSHLTDLDISGNIEIKALPNDIGNIPGLKYLDISNTKITQLPNTLINHPELESIHWCKTLVHNAKKLDRLYQGKIDWEWNCEQVERTIVNFEEKYGGYQTYFAIEEDTLVLLCQYFYNEPNSVDEEFWRITTIKIALADIKLKQKIQLPDSNVKLSVIISSVWHLRGNEYSDLKGHFIFIKKGTKKIKVSLILSGKFYPTRASEELINKTQIYKEGTPPSMKRTKKKKKRRR